MKRRLSPEEYEQEREKQIAEFERAKAELYDFIINALRIPQILDWLESKLPKE